MGYESRLFIVEKSDYKNFESGIVIAEYDLCKMGYANDEFFRAFTREIGYTIFLPTCDSDGNEIMDFLDEDRYGEHMKAASIPVLLSALEAVEARSHYRRLPPLIAMLKAFDASEWDGELEVVHFGY